MRIFDQTCSNDHLKIVDGMVIGDSETKCNEPIPVDVFLSAGMI